MGYVVDGANLYVALSGTPVARRDPTGLTPVQTDLVRGSPPASGPATGPTTGPTGTVTARLVPGRGIRFTYNGDDEPTFCQTVRITLPPGATSSDKETAEHGGHDPTKGPVGDNASGDPARPLGTDKDGNATRDPKNPNAGGYNSNGSTDDSRKTTTDAPGPRYPGTKPGEFIRVRKDFVTTVCDSQGRLVRRVRWHVDSRGTTAIDE